MMNYWWVTRPKRKLNAIPEVLTVFADIALGQVWGGQRNEHLSLEDAFELNGIKRIGDRRDQTGGGARTYKAWLMSLGLIFTQHNSEQIRLTLAGDAIIRGESPVKIIKNQVIKYQFPSAFSLGRGIDLNPRFRIHPFWFLLKLMADNRIEFLTKDEIAKILITEADSDSDECYEKMVSRIIEYRNSGDQCLPQDFFEQFGPSRTGIVNPAHPFSHLYDIANTMMNWMEYTQLVSRNFPGQMRISEDAKIEAERIVSTPLPFIARPNQEEYFQRKYGLDPEHQRDDRNFLATHTVTARMIDERKIQSAFLMLSLSKPIAVVNAEIISEISRATGISEEVIEETLQRDYPHGAIASFMAKYFEMAFNGRENCTEFETATANIFKDIFGFDARHIAGGAREVPDVLLISGGAEYQAIIDTKAYREYDLPATQRDRMAVHYIPELSEYSESTFPLSFFSYIAGGFKPTINHPLQDVISRTGISGSAVPVQVIIKMVEKHKINPYSHEDIRHIFSLNRRIGVNDI